MKYSPIAIFLAGSTVLTSPAFAQDDVVELDTLFVGANSLIPVDAARSGANVEVLQGDEVGARDERVLDRLVRLPGVNLTSNGSLGASASIQVRGLPSRYTGVRIDGIDVSDPSGTQTQFNFGGYTASGVERVELLKGSQSAIFGSEAIAGVVNITTFRPSELGFSGLAEAEYGSFDTASGSLSVGYRSEEGYVALSYGRIVSDGISAQTFNEEDDGFRQTTINMSSEYALSDTITVGGALHYRDGVNEFDRSAFSDDATGEISAEEFGARVFATFETGVMTHTLSYSYFDIDRQDPGGFTTRFQGERRTLAYLGSAALNDITTLNIGVEDTNEDIDSGTSVGSESNTSYTAEMLFSPTGSADFSFALRHDDNSSFGGQTTGRITGVYRPREDIALRASIGTGYRAPSLFERFSAFGDPDLQPENSVGVEIGVEKSYGSAGYVKATLFRTEIDDLIDFDPVSTACESGFGCYNQVPGETVAQGFEVSGEYALSGAYSLYGAYTYTDAKTDGTRLTRTPRHDLTLGLSGEFGSGLSAYVDVRHVADVEPSAFAPADNKVGDYTLVGVGAAYEVTDDAEVYLRVENLFDEDYETAGGFNQPGRAAYFGVRARF